MIELLTLLILLIVGYLVGTWAEKRHYKSIRQRERQTLHLPAVTFGAKQPLPQAQEAALFVGSVVVSVDYFKRFASTLRNLVGGRVVVYESLLDRGRREALLRMKEDALAWGATQVVNVRLETARIGNQDGGNGPVAIEVIAYGTGVR
ncbi:MAG: YbjQ family protein [Cyanophyceae cyanobacterium]